MLIAVRLNTFDGRSVSEFGAAANNVRPGGGVREVCRDLIKIASVHNSEGGGPLVVGLGLVPVKTILQVILERIIQVCSVLTHVFVRLVVFRSDPLVSDSSSIAPDRLVVLSPCFVGLGVGSLVKHTAEGGERFDITLGHFDGLTLIFRVNSWSNGVWVPLQGGHRQLHTVFGLTDTDLGRVLMGSVSGSVFHVRCFEVPRSILVTILGQSDRVFELRANT